MTMTVTRIVLETSDQLNDQGLIPYTRWTQAMLVGYLNDALIAVGVYRPDAFTSSVAIPLVPGSQQTLPAGASLLSAVTSNGTNSNCPGYPITEANLDIMRSFSKKVCMPSGGAATYRITNFSYDAKNPNIFYVSPPVPDDQAGIEVNANVLNDAPQYTASDIFTNTVIAMNQKYYNALEFYMLMRAYEVDTESVSSRQTKLDNQGMFFRILGVDYKQESLYRSGWWLGQRGQGDPRSGAH